MTLRAAGLTFRILRFETTIVVGATILSILVTAAVIGALNATGWVRCLTDGAIEQTAFCQASLGSWLLRIGRMSAGIVPVFPIVAGLLIGGPIVARELESGTARLAWSLGPSRLRWFVQRAVPALLLVTAAGVAIGLAADALLHLMQPQLDIDRSFAGFRQRGLLIGVQALLVAATALAVGAILGRAVPTFVLSLVLVSGVAAAVDKVESQLLTNEALVTDAYTFDGGDLFLESRLRLPDGRIVTWQELADLHPEIMENGFSPDQYPNVVLYIPGARYHDIERREAIVLLGLAALFIVLASFVVTRRRPR